MELDKDQLMKLAIALGICYVAYKYVPMPLVKTMAVGVAGTIVAKQVPYISDVI